MRDIMLIQLYEEGARPLTGKGTVTARPVLYIRCWSRTGCARYKFTRRGGFCARMFFFSLSFFELKSKF